MSRPVSKVAPDSTLEPEIHRDAVKTDETGLAQLARPGFHISFYDSLEEFYVAEALEYIEAWSKASADKPAGICGPIRPTEQLPLVARMVNSLELPLEHAHFWGMDEWVENGQPVAIDHPQSFAKADMDLCFNRINQ
jgi:glucosamine-6-phosphate deaminase